MYANIRAEMARQGKTQTDIAKLLNISPNSLRWKLNGERPFLLDEVFTLAKTFRGCVHKRLRTHARTSKDDS